MRKNIFCSLFFFCILQNLSAQKEMPVIFDNTCNDSARIAKSTVIIEGKPSCVAMPDHDAVLFFTATEDFDNYIAKNRSVRGQCGSREPLKLDLTKYDVGLVRIGLKACGMPLDTFSCEIKNGKLIVYVYLDIRSPGCEDLQIFSSYFLIPKGETSEYQTEFHFCINK